MTCFSSSGDVLRFDGTPNLSPTNVAIASGFTSATPPGPSEFAI